MMTEPDSSKDTDPVTREGEPLHDASPAAMKAAFLQGVRETLKSFAELGPAPPVQNSSILPVSSYELRRMFVFADRIGDTSSAHSAGNAFAATALAFDRVMGDPGFEKAAEFYVATWLPAHYPSEEDLHAQERLLHEILETMECVTGPVEME